MYGTTRLRLYSKTGLTNEQVSLIEEQVKKNYIGLEVIKQSRNELVIEDISDIKEMSIKKISSRLRYLVSQEFEEALDGRNEDIKNSEEIVDRFYLYGIRYLNMTKPKNMYFYLRYIQMLEFMADLLIRIAKMDDKAVKRFLADNRDLFELSLSALDGKREAINKALKSEEDLLKKIYAKKLTDYQHALLVNLTRTTGAIAELGMLQEKSRSEELLPE